MNKSILLVANFDSDVGYAWWLMESYWAAIAAHCAPTRRALLAYPSISRIPESIAHASLDTVECDFTASGVTALTSQLRFLRKHAVESIYFTDQRTISLRFLLFRLVGVRRIIVHDHTPGVRTLPVGIKLWLKYLMMRLPLINADAVFSTSVFVRQRHILVNRIPADRCFVVRNGIPSKPIAEAADLGALFKIPPQRVVMVTVARANAYKNIDFALRCLHRLATSGELPDLHYLFCGDGPDLKNLEALALTLGVSDRVTFAGRRSDVPTLLSAADFAFHPSRGEVGYSLAILEYMQACLPVIVPDNPSVCGATRDGVDGMIYREDDIDDACDKLSELARDRALRDKLGAAARSAVRERFDLEISHRDLVGALHSAGVL